MKLGLTQLLPKAPPTTDPRSKLLYALPQGSEFTLRVMVWCCWGGLNSRPRHYQSKGRTTRKYGYLRFSGNRTWAFANDPRQTQTVRSCCLGGFLLKVLWSNKIGKSDLRRTYGTLPDLQLELMISRGLVPPFAGIGDALVPLTEQSYRAVACAFKGNKHADGNSN